MATETTVMRTLNPQDLLSQAIEKGANLETLERLVALAKDVRVVQAREAWHEAMAEFQRRCPAIKKTNTAKIVTAKASYSYRYAPLDEIMETIRPVLGGLGLSVSWSSRVEPEKVIVSCRVSHALGHSETSGEISMPIGGDQDRSGGNPAQRVGSALTYARRYSLLSVTGLAPEDDDDAQGTERGEHPGNGDEQEQREARKALTFPFPDDVKGKTPDECDLATLNKILPIFEKAVNDPKNKWAEQNKKLVAAIQEAIAEKTAKPDSPAGATGSPPPQENSVPPPPAGEPHTEPDAKGAAMIRIQEHLDAGFSKAKVTKYIHENYCDKGHKNPVCDDYRKLDTLAAGAVVAWISTQKAG